MSDTVAAPARARCPLSPGPHLAERAAARRGGRPSVLLRWLALGVVVGVTACSFTKGGYYGGDGPPRGISKADLDRIPDAVPRPEPLSESGNDPYVALGRTYYPMKTARNYRERGIASWYGRKFHGHRTSSGEPYDMLAMTAAHKVLPLPTYVRVRNLENGKTVVVKVNDRGPFLHDRLIDLSYAAAYRLGVTATGTGLVEVTAIDPRAAAFPVSAPVRARSVDGLRLYVQFGAFSIRSNAEALKRRLYGQGFQPAIYRGMHNGYDIYRVRVGPYSQVRQVDEVTAMSRRYGYDTKLIIE